MIHSQRGVTAGPARLRLKLIARFEGVIMNFLKDILKYLWDEACNTFGFLIILIVILVICSFLPCNGG